MVSLGPMNQLHAIGVLQIANSVMGRCDRIRATGQDNVFERAQSGIMAAPNSFSAYRDTTAEREERRTRGSSAQLRAMEARRIALAQLRRTGMQKKARATAIKRENAMRDVSEKGVDSPDKPGRKDEPTRVGRVVASDPSASPDHQVSPGSNLLTPCIDLSHGFIDLI